MREYKCWNKRCAHGGKVTDNIAVKVGSKRYHKDCKMDIDNLKKVRELYIEFVDPAVVHMQLNKVINTLIEDKKVDSEFLLFVIEFIIEKDIEVNVPFSLYYKVTDYKIKKAYKDKFSNLCNNNLTIHS